MAIASARRRAMSGLCLGWAGVGMARAADAGPALRDTGHAVALPGTHEFRIRSATGRDYRIFVAPPPGTATSDGHGVLVVLDGNAYFGAAAQAMHLLAKFQSAPILVVGVGYPGDEALHKDRRTWDFLPPPLGPVEPHRIQLQAQPGGADAFLDFLMNELRPALQARYRLRPDRHTLMGHSLGGYFTLHALARRPQAFQRHAAISPSLWWDGQRLVDEMKQARPAHARVLLAVAREELPGHPDRSAAMLDGARRMRDVLAADPPAHAQPSSALQYLEVEREDHLSMALALMPTIVRFAAAP